MCVFDIYINICQNVTIIYFFKFVLLILCVYLVQIIFIQLQANHIKTTYVNLKS